jgi:16S rRNA (cytosine1402-N4)-methyltransferase
MRDGPLDMRMDRGAGGTPSAAEIVNTAGEALLARILYVLGEERASRRIARAIAEARSKAPITRTGELAALVERTVGRKPGRDKIHPATRTFQALRIHVNRELEQLAAGLAAAERLLTPGGRLAVVSFHSLEDRIVKSFLAERSGRRPKPSRHMPAASDEGPAGSFAVAPGGARKPSKGEIAANPRCRSARLRAAVRTDAPPVPLDPRAVHVPAFD